MADSKFDYKKEYKDLYMPGTKPCLVDVPPIGFIMVDGKGDPNMESGEYAQSVELLYGLTYCIKMSKMKNNEPSGYFEYVVPPLEGLWWLSDNSRYDLSAKDKFCFTSMIRQPEFVTQEVFVSACEELAKKKPHMDTTNARFMVYHEGLCIQMMHIGPFDTEPVTIALIDAFIKNNQLRDAISDTLPDSMTKRHHEIYLNDPRKTQPAKLKTIVRHPVKPL